MLRFVVGLFNRKAFLALLGLWFTCLGEKILLGKRDRLGTYLWLPLVRSLSSLWISCWKSKGTGSNTCFSLLYTDINLSGACIRMGTTALVTLSFERNTGGGGLLVTAVIILLIIVVVYGEC